MKDASTMPSRISPGAPRRWTRAQLESAMKDVDTSLRCLPLLACRHREPAFGNKKEQREAAPIVRNDLARLIGCDHLAEGDAGLGALRHQADDHDFVFRAHGERMVAVA